MSDPTPGLWDHSYFSPLYGRISVPASALAALPERYRQHVIYEVWRAIRADRAAREMERRARPTPVSPPQAARWETSRAAPISPTPRPGGATP